MQEQTDYRNTFLTKTPVAHRGLHDENYPENTMPAFLAAVENGFPIESDVRLSADGTLYLFHDDTLTRLVGVEKNFIDCTSEEIDSYLVEGKEHIPTLAEFLKAIDGRTPILMEIKNVPECENEDFIAKIATAFDGYEGEYAIQSFNPTYVKLYKNLRPEIACGILATAESSKADFGGSVFWRIKAKVVKNMSMNRFIKPDFISYCFPHYPNKATDKFKGVKLGWTVRSLEDEAYARKYADNIIFENYIPQKPQA